MIYGVGPGGVLAITPSATASFMTTQPSGRQYLSRITSPAGCDILDAYFLVDPAAPWPKPIERALRPVIVIVGDDPGTADGLGGPSAWRCTSRLRYWPRAAMVHVAAGDDAHYAEVTAAALKVGRVVLVETTSSQAEKWKERLACQRTLMILPRGGVHPIPTAEAMR
jgi:hypothetical protein